MGVDRMQILGVSPPFPPQAGRSVPRSKYTPRLTHVCKTIQLKLNCILSSAVTDWDQPTSVGFSHKNRGFGSVYFLAVSQNFFAV